MKISILIFVSLLVIVTSFPNTPAVNDEQAKKYLQKYGYVIPSNLLTSSAELPIAVREDDPQALRKAAIQKVQKFAGLTQTGVLDDPTRSLMAKPRCDDPDILPLDPEDSAYRGWKHMEIKYSIIKFLPHMSPNEIRTALREAFDAWSRVTPLQFIEVPSNDLSADIKIIFASGAHGDSSPFDGKNGVLAHALPPPSGDLHFDEDEAWTFRDASKIARNFTDIYTVAVHEIGHTLGLYHIPHKEAVMSATYHYPLDDRGQYKKIDLTSWDIAEIQRIYGSKKTGFIPRRASSSKTPMMVSIESEPGAASTCREKCRAKLYCKHFAWNAWEGGTCWFRLKKRLQAGEKPVPKRCLGYRNKAIEGQDMISIKGGMKECCTLCRQHQGCKAFSWSSQGGGRCYLKSGSKNMRFVNGMVTGIIPQEKCKNQFKTQSLLTRDEKLTDCCSICRKTRGCKAFAWNDFEGGTCWLKKISD